MKIYILLSITFLLFTTGCKKDETSEPDYYFELKIGDEEYNTDSDKLLGEEYFHETTYYDFSSNEIEWAQSLTFGSLEFSDNMDMIDWIILSLTQSYITNDTYPVCGESDQYMSISLNITQNDNEVGGNIAGTFSGSAVYEDYEDPCDYPGCCYDKYPVSGKFKLKIQ